MFGLIIPDHTVTPGQGRGESLVLLGPFVSEGIEKHLGRSTVQLDAAKAQILDR